MGDTYTALKVFSSLLLIVATVYFIYRCFITFGDRLSREGEIAEDFVVRLGNHTSRVSPSISPSISPSASQSGISESISPSISPSAPIQQGEAPDHSYISHGGWARGRISAGSIASSSISHSSIVSSSVASYGPAMGHIRVPDGLRNQVREEILNELKEEGKLVSPSSLKPMTKERRKRRLDAILKKGEDENE